MSRWVIPAGQGYVAGDPQEPDGRSGRIVKYVPAEIIAPFTMLYSALVSLGVPADQGQKVAVGLIFLFFIVTIAYIASQTTGSVRRAQLAVSPLAFLAWAYPISSALLGSLFVGLAALILQALVIALSIIVRPTT
jgi:hypothetical protein